jgi:hypothetical protein
MPEHVYLLLGLALLVSYCLLTSGSGSRRGRSHDQIRQEIAAAVQRGQEQGEALAQQAMVAIDQVADAIEERRSG